MGRLADLLQKRSPVVHAMEPDRTVADAVAVMAEHQIGAIPVLRDGELIGIFSERDLLRRVVAPGRSLEKTLLRDVMTADPVVLQRDDPISWALHRMGIDGVRHIPVLDGDRLDGFLSMRTVLKLLLDS